MTTRNETHPPPPTPTPAKHRSGSDDDTHTAPASPCRALPGADRVPLPLEAPRPHSFRSPPCHSARWLRSCHAAVTAPDARTEYRQLEHVDKGSAAPVSRRRARALPGAVRGLLRLEVPRPHTFRSSAGHPARWLDRHNAAVAFIEALAGCRQPERIQDGSAVPGQPPGFRPSPARSPQLCSRRRAYAGVVGPLSRWQRAYAAAVGGAWLWLRCRARVAAVAAAVVAPGADRRSRTHSRGVGVTMQQKALCSCAVRLLAGGSRWWLRWKRAFPRGMSGVMAQSRVGRSADRDSASGSGWRFQARDGAVRAIFGGVADRLVSGFGWRRGGFGVLGASGDRGPVAEVGVVVGRGPGVAGGSGCGVSVGARVGKVRVLRATGAPMVGTAYSLGRARCLVAHGGLRRERLVAGGFEGEGAGVDAALARRARLRGPGVRCWWRVGSRFRPDGRGWGW